MADPPEQQLEEQELWKKNMAELKAILRHRRLAVSGVKAALIERIMGKPLTGIATASVQQLLHYAWPGNIRELEHVLERAAILSYSPTLALAESLGAPLTASAGPVDSVPVRPLQVSMREAILAALAQSGNRVRGSGGAAELLNIKPTTLEARMKKLAINVLR